MLHEWFELVISLKWIWWVLDIVRWLLFIFITPERVNKWLFFFLQPELIEDPGDTIATHIMNLGSNFSTATQHFISWYLICYGAFKVLVSILLYKKIRWAYPLVIYFLFIFIWYQIYRYTNTHAIMLLILSIFDLIVIYLTWIEYVKLNKQK